MSGCDVEPAVNNARASLVADNDTVTVTYQCLAGFYMTGTARLVCNRTLDIWASPPTCEVITQSTNFYNYNNIPSVDGWWYYLLVGLLTVLALLLLGGLIWCCCCASIVHPHTTHTDSNCCHCRPSCSRRQTKIGLDTTKNLPEHRQAGNHVLVGEANGNETGNTSPGMDLTLYLEEDIVWPQNVQTRLANDGNLSSQRESLEYAKYDKITNVEFMERTRQIPVNQEASNRVSESRGQVTAQALKNEPEAHRNVRQANDTSRDKKIWLPHTRVIRDNDTTAR